MFIRHATSEDMPKILDLGRVLHMESAFRDYPLDANRVREAIGQVLGNPGLACLLLAVNRDGAVAGMLAARMGNLFYFDKQVAQEQMFYVHPAWRGTSAAIKLLIACRKWARNRGADEFIVSINSGVGIEKLPRLMKRLHFNQLGMSFSLRLTESVG